MLSFRSSGLSRARIATWEDERRKSRREDTVRRFTIGADLGDRRLEADGAEGTTGTARLGGAGG
jgi:hypothetical protein